MPLDRDGERLFLRLLDELPRINPRRPETFLGYQRIHEDLGLPQKGLTYGSSLERQGMGNLAYFLKKEGLPSLTGLIVDEGSRMPGRGYFELYDKTEDDFDWWRNEVEKAKKFDWNKYIPLSLLPLPPITRSAVDISDPPGRLETTIYRVIRDTPLSRRLKQAHNYECQICGTSIELCDGSRYVEAHHIKPLGSPHHGPDVEGNIICLCPNHHVQLDYGVIALNETQLRTIPQHAVGAEFLSYHNSKIFKPAGDER
jgi:hypothetical protein